MQSEKQSDHKRIWLEPAPGADEEYGRQWMHHNVWGDEATEYVRADLSTPPPVAGETGKVRVKELVWVEHGDLDFVWHRAVSLIGYHYNIEDDGFSEKKYHLTVGQLVMGNFHTLDEAKSAAQADCEQRILSAIEVSAAPATRVPDGWQLVPKEPSDALLKSMAVRYDHGLGVPGYYDKPVFGAENVGHEKRMTATIATMRQLHEEVVGTGFHRPSAASAIEAPPADELRAALLSPDEKHIGVIRSDVGDGEDYRIAVKQWAGEPARITFEIYLTENRWASVPFLPADAVKVAALILSKPAVIALDAALSGKGGV
ncbi:hypothetical protein [Pararhizobium sp.]|uniref:hypothetical protein n=1 Tax=Pararhizobium sp. TaxID=1977563 RepID=UPI0027293BEF|nr:hypothetical protein [Pararhizobium sp.]MDO9416979.1 hypothetical protein [Pararhizobium sp.]